MDQLFKKADIDQSGSFKYIQILVKNKETEETTTLVRGYKSCSYHAHIMEKF